MNHSPPPQKKPFGGAVGWDSWFFFFTPLKRQYKPVNKADSIYSYLLYTGVKNGSEGLVSEYYPTRDLYVVENAGKCWTGLELLACDVVSTCVAERKRYSAFPH